MSELQPTGQSPNPSIEDLFSNCPLKEFEDYKTYIVSHPLYDRVTNNWKIILMDCSTAIAIIGFVATFFMGSALVCTAFLFTAVASGVGSFYMRQFSTLSDLENTAKDLRETKEKFEGIAKDLEKENQRLCESNRQLEQNNAVYRENNQTLIQTNGRLNNQVTQLTLQVTQLRESADKIRSEVVRFQQQNSHLHTNVRGFDESLRTLDQQILNSRALCEQIRAHLASQQLGLGQQMEQLGRYLSDLRADNRVSERIQELANLQKEVLQATKQLHEIQVQYATERANFQTIHTALVQLRNQFDQAIRDASNNMQANNQQFKDNVTALASERQRIHDLIHRHFSNSPPLSG